MRVDINNEADFVMELEACQAEGRIHQHVVRFTVERQPEQKEAISHKVIVWATFLTITAEGHYLTEYIEDCGRDTKAGNTGSEQAAARKAEIAKACHRLGLKLRGGRLEDA